MFYGPPDEMRNEPLRKHRREATFLQHWQTEIRADALCLGHSVDSVSQTCNYLTSAAQKGYGEKLGQATELKCGIFAKFQPCEPPILVEILCSISP